MTILEAAVHVLRSMRRPLSTREILERIVRGHMVESVGKTPETTLAATLYRHLRTHRRLRQSSQPGLARAQRGSVRRYLASAAEKERSASAG